MKKTNELLNDYRDNLARVSELETERSKLINAGSADKKTIGRVKDIDVEVEILRAGQVKIRADIVNAIKPEAKAEKTRLSKEFENLMSQEKTARRDFIQAVAVAVAQRERFNFETRQRYDGNKGGVVAVEAPSMPEFTVSRLDADELEFYRNAIKTARAKYSPGEPLDRQLDEIRRLMDKQEKILSADPAKHVDDLLRPYHPQPEPVDDQEPYQKQCTERVINYDAFARE